MYTDIVFPNKNETKFIHQASLLGYNGLCLTYSLKEMISKEKLKELKTQSKISIHTAAIIDKQSQLQKAKTSSDIVIVRSKDDAFDRNLLERGKIDLIFDLENSPRSDFIHQRNSGLNHIFCRLATKKAIVIGTSFSNIFNKFPFERAQVMGRMKQNIRLCKKYNTKTIFASFAKKPTELRSPTDLQSFLISIGSDNQIAKESLINLSEMIEDNKTRISEHIKFSEF
ncbi:hypothetical protein ISS04_00065 [Candidatus Woesearchaeota archaeon]|nr:hypothetical protein [Candidatus Woesearchaeota archaeon]